MKRLNVGMVGTYIPDFQGAKFKILENSITELEKLASSLKFNFFPIKRAVWNLKDAERAAQELEDKKIDFLLIQLSSFPNGNVLFPLLEGRKFVGLWAVPEPKRGGRLPLNSFCGLNLFASNIKNYFKEKSIIYKWFYGNPNDELFKERFYLTIKVLTSLVNLRNSHIGLIGGVASGFFDLYTDKRLIEDKFGLKISEGEVGDIIKTAESLSLIKVNKVIDKMLSNLTKVVIPNFMVEKMVRIYLAFKDLVKDMGLDALAVSCWPKFQESYAHSVCAALATLNSEGIPAACEGDIIGAVEMLLGNYVGGSVAHTMLMDISDINEENQTLLIWHCGVGTKEFADEKGVVLDYHFCQTADINGKKQRIGAVHNVYFQPQPVTVIRITPEIKEMLLFTADITEDKKSFQGSRAWLGNIRLGDDFISIRDLINTIINYGIPHHYTIIKGDIKSEIREICAWLNIEILDEISYKPYLQIR